ncbi:hypothetical protein CKALI_09430 [Corynebacterium kalinowskii]|uniref:DUF1707 domain-containing protein n=1 Tax=Corynebacterium kalinowskii TaxID=2675216 RepID=A0A6B8VS71_9CORY|nr:DUF1707 domain-containing protein [Corynebacterium kalinowskii]QGU02741.1 hypothetical protein CKALI_09430 [Corynebacterium kalinowskii]
MMSIERQHYLVGDFEREHALEKLKAASQSGHLSLVEFDQRAARATHATTQADIDLILADIPQNLMVKQNRTSGLQKRIGIVALWASLVPLVAIGAADLAAIFAVLTIPLCILLFIMKVGPDSWYEPKTIYKQIGQ